MSLVEAGPMGQMKPVTPSAQQTAQQTAQQIVCFPLETFLAAIPQRTVDFLGLDVEGLDYQVLAAVPWHALDIRVSPVPASPSLHPPPRAVSHRVSSLRKVLMVESNKGTRKKIMKLMVDHDYRHVKRTSMDDVYERLPERNAPIPSEDTLVIESN